MLFHGRAIIGIFQAGLKAFAFLPFMVITSVSALLTFKYVKETKNKTYEEIAQIYYGQENDEIDQVSKRINPKS